MLISSYALHTDECWLWHEMHLARLQAVDLVQELRDRGLSADEACAFLDTSPPCSFKAWCAVWIQVPNLAHWKRRPSSGAATHGLRCCLPVSRPGMRGSAVPSVSLVWDLFHGGPTDGYSLGSRGHCGSATAGDAADGQPPQLLSHLGQHDQGLAREAQQTERPSPGTQQHAACVSDQWRVPASWADELTILGLLLLCGLKQRQLEAGWGWFLTAQALAHHRQHWGFLLAQSKAPPLLINLAYSINQ